MSKSVLVVLVVLGTMAAAAAAGFWYVRATGLKARGAPGAVEARVARAVRSLAIPRAVGDQPNPVQRTDEALAQGRAHFADHCASCHANDGSGNTDLGRGLFPPAPDMRLAATQNLSDGELFWIIENGIRFTGMPAWSTGTTEGETASWELVHFIRRLPELTEADIEEMEALNLRSPVEIRQEIEAERFLRGDDVAPAGPATHGH